MDGLKTQDLIISGLECELLGLKIGRLDVKEKVHVDYVIECIRTHNLDLLRLKIENPIRELYSHLDRLPYNYYLLNISQCFEAKKNTLNSNESFDNVLFQDYTQEYQEVMKEIVMKSFSTHDGSYYYNPKVSGIYNSSDELNSMAVYMSNEFHDGEHRWAKLVFAGEIPVGFVSYKITGEVATGDMFGVLPEYQRSGIGRKIGIYVLSQLSNKTVRNYVQIQQIPSLNLHYSLGMKPTGIVLNFHITNIS